MKIVISKWIQRIQRRMKVEKHLNSSTNWFNIYPLALQTPCDSAELQINKPY